MASQPGLLRVRLVSTPIFANLGLNDTIKTVLVKEGTAMKEANEMLVGKITRGVTPENRAAVETEIQNGGYQFIARHQVTNSFSQVLFFFLKFHFSFSNPSFFCQ